MRRLSILLAVLFIALSTSAMGTAVRADEGENGAVPPPEEDPLAESRSAAKARLIRALAAEHGAGKVLPIMLGMPIVGTTADQIGPDYAELDMPVWMEPQTPYKYSPSVYPYNWCGPGATSGVASRWKVLFTGSDPVPTYPANGVYPSGKDAYQNHLAYDLGEVSNLGNTDPWDDITSYPQMVSATNSAAGAGGFYVTSSNLTFNTYLSYLYYDLHDSIVPLIPVVHTNGMPGWGIRNVHHWVTVKQFWQGGNTTTYGDSAGPIQGSSSTYGWHVVNLDYFYQRIVAAYNKIVW